jgi:hypothetical protein
VHLTISTVTEAVEASASFAEDADVLTQSPSAVLSVPDKGGVAQAVAPLVVLSYLSLAVLAAVGATAAAIGVRSIVQF